jgi:hypothetical protein
MQVTISGLVGRVAQSLPQTTDGLPVVEIAIVVPTSDGKDWFALQFVGIDLVNAAQAVRKDTTIRVTGDPIFEPLPDGSGALFKPVVNVLGLEVVNSATSNLIILTAEINGDKLTGTAIDGDIKVLFTVGASEVNQGLFVPEANLVVSGKFRLGRDACTVGIAISSVIAVVSLPVATPIEVATPSETQIAPTKAPAKSKRKTSTTRSKKAAKTPIAA